MIFKQEFLDKYDKPILPKGVYAFTITNVYTKQKDGSDLATAAGDPCIRLRLETDDRRHSTLTSLVLTERGMFPLYALFTACGLDPAQATGHLDSIEALAQGDTAASLLSGQNLKAEVQHQRQGGRIYPRLLYLPVEPHEAPLESPAAEEAAPAPESLTPLQRSIQTAAAATKIGGRE